MKGQLEENNILNVSYVSLSTGAYIGFNADKQEIGFGTKQFHANDDYHIIQGIYVNKMFGNEWLKNGNIKEGNRYEGQEMNGKMTGLGHLTFFKNGNIFGKYEGYLKNNQFDGKGKFVLTNGNTYSGTYKVVDGRHHMWTGITTEADSTKRTCSKKYNEGVEEEC